MPIMILLGLGGLGFVIHEIRGAARDVQQAAPKPVVWVAIALAAAAILKRGRR